MSYACSMARKVGMCVSKFSFKTSPNGIINLEVDNYNM